MPATVRRYDPPTGWVVPMPQLETPFDLADLLIQPADMRPLRAQGLHNHRRQTLRDPLQRKAYPTPHPGRPCGMTSPYPVSSPRRPLICAVR